MRIDIEKKWNFGSKDACVRNLVSIREMIKLHIWCPPPRNQKGVYNCELCEVPMNLDKREPSYYAVWVGFICPRCRRVYEKEIEELSLL